MNTPRDRAWARACPNLVSEITEDGRGRALDFERRTDRRQTGSDLITRPGPRRFGVENQLMLQDLRDRHVEGNKGPRCGSVDVLVVSDEEIAVAAGRAGLLRQTRPASVARHVGGRSACLAPDRELGRAHQAAAGRQEQGKYNNGHRPSAIGHNASDVVLSEGRENVAQRGCGRNTARSQTAT